MILGLSIIVYIYLSLYYCKFRLHHHLTRVHDVKIKSQFGKELILRAKSLQVAGITPSETQEMPEAILDTNSITFNLPSPDLPIPKKVQFSLTPESAESSNTNEDYIIPESMSILTNDFISPPTKFASDSEYFTPEVVEDENLLPQDSYTQLPTKGLLLEHFQSWMRSMDGGCQTIEISNKAKVVVNNILDVVCINEIMHPEKISSYFTSKQMKKELTASNTNVYLRYYSAFSLFLHQNYGTIFPLKIYSNIQNRIQRYVQLIITN